ncbi:hypothetical protein AB1Y20_021699 [Prymnesium parvum]|uniref:Uncharacterized protein n=1 Tax=Prymnesium parvum TaxID=97485 RepID=A0AB34JMY7_PRYPA
MCGSISAVLPSADVARTQPSRTSPPRVPVTFSSFQQYEAVFGTLLFLSSDAARAEEVVVIDSKANVKWDVGIDRSPVAVVLSRLLASSNPAVGDNLAIFLGAPATWQAIGSVLHVDATSVAISITSWTSQPSPDVTVFQVSKAWNSLPFERMLLAVSCFARSEFSMSRYLRTCILGVLPPLPPLRVVFPPSWSAPGLRELNDPQRTAVEHACLLPPPLPHPRAAWYWQDGGRQHGNK